MVRLVKGAYWDSEIKRAQVDGLEDFPVFTRKVHTDVCYLASARKLLAAPDAIFPQFATHNAQTLASVMTMAGPSFYRGQYEFQCLHGMGEPLYEEVVGRHKLDRPCRVYAPVGSHETLLAYLVRRLLENGANTSFVNRIADASVPVDELIADPVALALKVQPPGAPHEKIALPRDLYGSERVNSRGVDFSNEQRLAETRASAGSERAGAPARVPAACRAERKGRAGAQSGRSRATSSAILATPVRTTSRPAIAGRGRGGADLGRRAAERTRGDPAPRRRRARGAERRAGRPDRARGGQDLRQCGRRSARGGRFPALLRRRGDADAEPGFAGRRSASSPASARGIFRWRSSPGRSPRRSPPAMRSSPSRRRRRR